MAKEKGGIEAIKAKAASLVSRLPFPKPASAPSPDPFSAVEDEAPLGDDLLSTDNAAQIAKSGKITRESFDFRGMLAGAFKSPIVRITSLSVLAFILIIAVVSVIVTAPPKAAKAAPQFTKEGIALVKTWLPPPGDPLAPRMAMEREGLPVYGPPEAAKLGIPTNSILLATLAERNDKAIDDLYGTAP
jgi:hypothetical protein